MISLCKNLFVLLKEDEKNAHTALMFLFFDPLGVFAQPINTTFFSIVFCSFFPSFLSHFYYYSPFVYYDFVFVLLLNTCFFLFFFYFVVVIMIALAIS